MKSGSLNLLKTSGPHRPVTGLILPEGQLERHHIPQHDLRNIFNVRDTCTNETSVLTGRLQNIYTYVFIDDALTPVGLMPHSDRL